VARPKTLIALTFSTNTRRRSASWLRLSCQLTQLDEMAVELGGEGALSSFDSFDPERKFREAWNAVQVARDVPYSLFTFGESELPYFLVLEPSESGKLVSLRQGQVKITRPLIITPDNAEPEFENFFESDDDAGFAQFLLSRTASFSHLRLNNQARGQRFVTDSVEETVSRLNRQLDADDEDRIAILTAPHRLAGFAVMRYAAERVMQSARDNITELRERGFLP
jgi:hypothetical protein